MATISVVVSAWNEEEKLARCLSSVKWATEIIVVDNSSTDATARVAKKFTQHVYKRPNHPMLNVNKNFGFEKATSDWLLSLDADEEIPPELGSEIQSVIRGDTSPYVGYWLPRKNIIFGKWIEHGLWWPDKQLRLFRRGKGKFPCKHVHEYLEVEGQTADLKHPFVHYNYESISQFVRKMDTLYTESEVQKLIRTEYQITWYDALRFPVSDFVKTYFAQEGYKDGLHGLVLSILQAFYSFVVFAKLWEHHGFVQSDPSIAAVEKEMDRAHTDLRYWTLSARMKQTTNTLAIVWFKFKRKFT